MFRDWCSPIFAGLAYELRGFRSRELTKLIDGTLGCKRKEKIKQFLTFAARKQAFGAILPGEIQKSQLFWISLPRDALQARETLDGFGDPGSSRSLWIAVRQHS